jgi:D-sedoheptulose 7-phosphate isomerase
VKIRKLLLEAVAESIIIKNALIEDKKIINTLEKLSEKCLVVLLSGGKIIFAGNGGSFADAQHLSAEFVSRFMIDRNPLPAIALGTNSSVMSAVGNDYGFQEVFAREIEAIGNHNDIFIPISTSGNSKNILNAVDVAIRKSIYTIGLTGQNGGMLLEKCETINVPTTVTARIQECHILLGHVLCQIVEDNYFSKK